MKESWDRIPQIIPTTLFLAGVDNSHRHVFVVNGYQCYHVERTSGRLFDWLGRHA